MQEENKDPDHRKRDHKQQTYVLSFDLGNKLQYLRQIGLKIPKPDDHVFTEIRQELINRFRGYFPNTEILGIDTSDLAAEIIAEATARRKLFQNARVVSTCMEIADSKRGPTIEINRIIDQGGKILGLGSRPGYPSLMGQIYRVTSVLDGAPIILVEDGTFTGSTIIYILEALKKMHVEVAAIVVGFAFKKAVDNIRRHSPAELVVIEKHREYLDWMPDHDFFPFVPGCGRVVGFNWRGQPRPMYSYTGASYSVPYLSTFCPVQEWTGITDPKHALDLSDYCARAGQSLFDHIQGLNNGKKLTMGDLLNVNPRISIPISVSQDSLPSLDTEVVDYYTETIKMLS